MSELGNKLKARREELGLSISEISLSTKIGARMITAIEEGEYKVLPALPFAKGFVRTYATYLKMDADEMVALYLTEIGETPEPQQEEEEASQKTPTAEPQPSVNVNGEPKGLTRYFIIGAAVLLIAAIVTVKNLVDKYRKEGEVIKQQEVSVSPIETPANEAPAPTPAPASASSENPPVSEIEQPTKAEIAPEPQVEPEIASKPEPKPETESEPQTAPEPKPSSETKAEDVAQPAPERKQVEILLEALDQVQINLSIGGENKRVSLNAGEVHILRTSDKVQLDISDGGAVNLVVNGRNRGVPGSLGQRKKVQLP